MSAVGRVLEHVEGVQEKGNGFWALCPAHDDHNPSLHIQQTDDGSALIICRAGCDQGDVVDALERRGLERSDLFASKQVASVAPLDGRSNASRSPSKGRERLVKNYHIKDKAGRLRGIHERWEDPEKPESKSFKWKLPNGRYNHGDISPAAMPLFGSELLADWPKNYRVVLCEGETPAAALRARNIRAVGTVCGAKLIPDAPALDVLRGRPVVVWGDGDPLGQKHAERLVRALRGVAASVQLYEWTDPPEGVKGPDAADHPAVRSGDREEVKALMRELRDAPEANVDHDQVPALRDRVLLGKIMREGVEPPEELVQDVLLAGKVHSLYSAASTGKTFLMLWLVLRVLEQGLRVLIFDRENGHRIMAERLEALGADPEKVDELLYYSFYPELRSSEEGLLDYENTLDEVKPALVVFDSLIGFLAANGLDENSGSIYRRKDGYWVGQYGVETATGRKTRYIYGKRREEVREKLTKAIADRDGGFIIDDENISVGECLNRWLNDSARGSVRASTYTSYEGQVRRYIIPAIGRIKLGKLTPAHIQHLYREMQDRGLSTRTVQYTHAVLRRALKQAERWGIVDRNVAEDVDPPRLKKGEIQPLDRDQTRTLLQAAEADRLHALYVVAVTAGLRPGEMLALRWSDVDLEAGALRINRALSGSEFAATKTPRSRRKIELSNTARAALRAHRKRQLEEQMKKAGLWKDHGLVFPSTVGTPLSHRNVVRSFKALLTRAGLPADTRLYDLRHTCATLLLNSNVHPKYVQELLGHASIAQTLDTYSHVLKGMDGGIGSAMDAAVG